MTNRNGWIKATSIAAVMAAAGLGCGGPSQQDEEAAEEAALGDALAGTNATTFADAKANFAATENNADGLGPIYNEHGCGACHQNGALGGAGQQIERRYGTLTNGVFDPLASTGGSLRQLFGIGGFNVGGLNCNAGTDANPAPGATIFAGRVTTPTFGAGLVELIPDSTIQAIAASQPTTPAPGIRGVAVDNVIQLTSGPFVRGQHHVARFGWKAVHASVADFAADAYLNEMGITTDHCAGGSVVRDFATENRANRAPTNAVINGCPDDQKPGVDDSVAAETNNCSGGITEVQDDVANFAFFMRALAPPPQVPITTGTAQDRGRATFASIGCNGCHVTTAFTVSVNGRNVSFQPFSDFLVHDMGTLGDGIGNAGDSVAVTRRMRTAPLWGLRSRNMKLHDGRTTDLATAISAHNGGTNGQGTAAAGRFNALSASQKNDLTSYLNTL